MRHTPYRRAESPAQLEPFIVGLKNGIIPSLVVVGRGGTGKSHVVRKHFPEGTGPQDGAWKAGRVTAVQFYVHLHENVGRTIVLDDPPNLARDLNLAGLLRQLCETRPVRTVSWSATNRDLQKNGIPSSFETTSRFIMVANRWMQRHEEVEALETRCTLVHYDPSVESLHELARSFEGVQEEVYAFVGKAIAVGQVHRINLRTYITASQDYRLGIDWRRFLEQEFLPDDLADLRGEEEALLGWCRTSLKKTFSARDLLNGPRRFRGREPHVKALLARMVADGELTEVVVDRPMGRRGRRADSRYRMATTTRMATRSTVDGAPSSIVS